MDRFQQLTQQVKNYILLLVVFSNLITMAVYIVVIDVVDNFILAAGLSFAVGLLLSLFVATFATRYALQPLQLLWQAIVHVSSPQSTTPAPNLDSARVGRELVTNLALQIYQFASQQDGTEQIAHRTQLIQAANIVSHMPLPLFVFNKEQLVTNASDEGLEYCKIESSTLFGKKLFDVLNLEFPNEFTLEQWITDCQESKVTDTAYWERVRIRIGSGDEAQLKQCDMAAYYNRDNPSGTEFIVTMFDRTKQYDSDDSNLSFVAIAVHELRTPLTTLRGYVEVFQDELKDSLTPELQDFMHKLQISADQLAAFVNNILNVARIEQNQLSLRLTEEKWSDILNQTVEIMKLRAQVHHKQLECTIDPKLPTVGIDRVSIQEVLTNLIDNAIKYSGVEDKKIIIDAYMNKEGLVETTIKDFGVGIPTSVLPNLFEKFQRNHRNGAQIGGTGLGLYLSKAIITAHGGQISVNSKEGVGSTFGFTLQPYSQLADEAKSGANNDIVRSAHGWIKNHSMYRR